MSNIKIIFDADEETLGLPSNNQHFIAKLDRDDCQIYFSGTRKGKALSAHFSSDKRGLRMIKKAVEDFCQWAFEVFPWCEMILAQIEKPSIARLIENCHFKEVLSQNGFYIYARCRKWAD